VSEIEPPAACLATSVLADQTIQPALDTPRQEKIGGVDGKHAGVIADARVEPVGEDDLEPERTPAGIGAFLPLNKKKKTVSPMDRWLTYRGNHTVRLQAVECQLQPLVVAGRSATTQERQYFIGRGGDAP